MKYLIVIFVLYASANCHLFAQDKKPAKAIAVLGLSDGKVFGNITFSQSSCTEPVVTVEVSIEGLEPGSHGFHVHEKGDLSGGCLSTGGHFNPDNLKHGGPQDQIRHVGDLGNVVANSNGVVSTVFSDSVISLFGAKSIIGRAIVVHSTIDDLGKTDHPDSMKTGNAGGRVACGVIGIAEISDANFDCDEGKNGASPLQRGKFEIISFVCILLSAAINYTII